jgi:hypothetical protein
VNGLLWADEIDKISTLFELSDDCDRENGNFVYFEELEKSNTESKLLAFIRIT